QISAHAHAVAAPYSRRLARKTIRTHATPASAAGNLNRPALGPPPISNAAHDKMYASGGFSRYTIPLICGIARSPLRYISHATPAIDCSVGGQSSWSKTPTPT